jgi:uncharacterized protein
MKTSRHDPLRLDLAAFAADGATQAGLWPGSTLTRLAESQSPPHDLALADVDWQAQGERRAMPAGEPETWLTLQVKTRVWLTCQRCLQPMAMPLALDQRLRFVQGETQAEALDAESEDDVLALLRWMDLRELVEDELLLALPLVPRHDTCPQPLPVGLGLESDAGATPAEVLEKPNPFAALRSLKTGSGGAGPKSD